MYYSNGVRLQEKLYKSVLDKTLSFTEFTAIENEEVKSAVLYLMQDLFEDSYVGEFIPSALTKVDSYTDNKKEKYLEGTTGGMNIGVYDLFKGNIQNEEVAFVRCYCPSSDRMFMLGVDPKHTTAKDSIASLYRVPKKLSGKIKEIRRQGEIFSTTFDSKEDLRNLTEKEAKDLISISGDRYFDLITYEY